MLNKLNTRNKMQNMGLRVWKVLVECTRHTLPTPAIPNTTLNEYTYYSEIKANAFFLTC